ncbi:hypothetical protein [Thermanaeromonas sp. C210]|uniref:hypothetical protein n=1 Tax=Thermanaeromonas sp. C210 TaxID=2731925 RepID=UPI00155B4F80|nr:hypothetical protein [Thermanaeromonas sp. C210]GFN23417.1 hypothetical protein TAMC210_17340 [Thermanaeromonas sp. C210]
MRNLGLLYWKEMRENLVATLIGMAVVAAALVIGTAFLDRPPWGAFLIVMPLYGLPIWYLATAFASIHHEWNQHTAYWLLSLPVREETILLAKALALVTRGLLISLPAVTGWGILLERASVGAFWPHFAHTYLLLYLLSLLVAFMLTGLVFLASLSGLAVIPRAGRLAGQLMQVAVMVAGVWLAVRFTEWLAEVLDFLPALPLLGSGSYGLGPQGFSLTIQPALPAGALLAFVLLAALFLWLAALVMRLWVEV